MASPQEILFQPHCAPARVAPRSVHPHRLLTLVNSCASVLPNGDHDESAVGDLMFSHYNFTSWTLADVSSSSGMKKKSSCDEAVHYGTEKIEWKCSTAYWRRIYSISFPRAHHRRRNTAQSVSTVIPWQAQFITALISTLTGGVDRPTRASGFTSTRMARGLLHPKNPPWDSFDASPRLIGTQLGHHVTRGDDAGRSPGRRRHSFDAIKNSSSPRMVCSSLGTMKRSDSQSHFRPNPIKGGKGGEKETRLRT